LNNKFKLPSATNVTAPQLACGVNCASCLGSDCAANKGLFEAERAAAKAEKARKAKEAAEAKKAAAAKAAAAKAAVEKKED
jgi:electron transport complex protein RnfE